MADLKQWNELYWNRKIKYFEDVQYAASPGKVGRNNSRGCTTIKMFNLNDVFVHCGFCDFYSLYNVPNPDGKKINMPLISRKSMRNF